MSLLPPKEGIYTLDALRITGYTVVNRDGVTILKGRKTMEYSILIEKITEEGFPEGYYYAHIPSLDLTTHGYGIEGAKSAALELVTLWLQEKAENNEPVHQENESYFSRLEIHAV